MITNYQELPIREEMKKAIAEMGFTEMTEIQQKAIPELLAGKGGHRQGPHRYR